MGMKLYQLRVVDECNELGQKLAKLNAFITSPNFEELEFVERELLLQQSRLMGEYHAVLVKRIEYWRSKMPRAGS